MQNDDIEVGGCTDSFALLACRMRKPVLVLVVPFVFTLSVTAQTLLVANQGDHTVSVVDADSAKQVAVIDEGVPGQWGHELATSPDGKTAYVPIYGNSGVGQPGIDGREMLVIDIASRKVTGRVDFGSGVRPHCVVYDPNSKLLYVTAELAKSVAVVDPRTLKVVGNIPTGAAESHMLALSHDGKRGYTANVASGTVSVLDIPGRKTVTVIPVAGRVQRISISKDDKSVFTSDQSKPELVVIDTATNKVKSRVALPAVGYGTASTADGRSLLVTLPSINKVGVVDLGTLKLTRTIDVCKAPPEIIIPGQIAYVSCARDRHVAAIDTGSWKVLSMIEVGNGDDGLAWAK